MRADDPALVAAEYATEHGPAAYVADVQEIPFADGDFDAVVAAWMLYHVVLHRRFRSRGG